MSSNVTSTGFMGVLLHPIMNQEIQEISNESFYERKINLRINYEGTLIYSQEGSDNEYGITFLENRNRDVIPFITDALREGIEIRDHKLIKPYICTWYNGSDSDMDMMTLEEFMK